MPGIGHSHDHGAGGRAADARALGIVLALTAGFAVLEVVGGLIAGSVALLADAGHMLSDAASLALALGAVWLARRPATTRMSFGWRRAEILAALANGVALVAVGIWILIEALQRLPDPPDFDALPTLVIGLAGLVVNVVGAAILWRSGGESLNVRAALFHVLADLLGSAGVVVAALLAMAFGWWAADPVAALLIGILVLIGRLAGAARVARGAAGGHPRGHRRRRGRAPDGRDAGRARGPRPARLDDHLGLPRAVGARPGRARARTATPAAGSWPRCSTTTSTSTTRPSRWSTRATAACTRSPTPAAARTRGAPAGARSYREGASDEQAMERLRYDLRWKVAVGVALDHPGYHPTSPVKFRARLLLHGRERLALERSIALAAELGLMKGSVEQIVDSTPMLGAAATQDTVRLVRSGVAKLIGAVAGADAEAAGALRRALAFDYSRPRDKPDCDWRSRPARERMLSEVAADARRAIAGVTAEPDLAGEQKVAEALALLDELIGQDFEIDKDDVPRLRRGVAHGRILSVVDPEMRHGRTSSAARFDGYKLHAAATSDGRLISAVGVSPGGDRDGEHAAGLVDQQPAGRRPARLLGDTAYGDQVTRAALEARRVQVPAPVPGGATAHGRFSKSDFRIDLDARVTSPTGASTICARPTPSWPGSPTSPMRSLRSASRWRRRWSPAGC